MSKKIEFTYNECLEIAKKYSKRSEFKEKNRTCFNFSKKMGWYDEITKHIPTKSPKKRSYEEVLNAAKLYKTRMEFKNNDMANYSYAVTHGWLDDVCSHMRAVGDMYKRCIYVYELPEKVCYVGLTFNIEARHLEHCNKKSLSSVRSYCEKNKIDIPNPKQLTDYVNSDLASKLEGEYLEKYKNDGWKILNVSKTGALGGKKHKYKTTPITIGLCKEKAMGCETPTEFQNKYRSLYRIMKEREWVKYVFSHFDKDEIKVNKNKKISLANKGRKRNINYEKWFNTLGTNKNVLQYSKNGELIAEYASQIQAAEKIKHPNSHSDIGKCCKGVLKTCLGYVWKYKEK